MTNQSDLRGVMNTQVFVVAGKDILIIGLLLNDSMICKPKHSRET